MKSLVLLLTGLTDAPLQDLRGVTPLQKALTPNLDRLAHMSGGLLAIPPKSGGVETSFLSLLGIEEETSAAAMEACALDLPLSRDETYYSGRLISSGGGAIVEVGDDLIASKEGVLLCNALTKAFKDEGVRFLHVAGPRCLMVTSQPFGPIPGPGPSPFEAVGQSWKGLLPKKVRGKLGKLLERVGSVLADHEVNALRSDLEEAAVNGLWISEGGGMPQWMEAPPHFEGIEIFCSTSVIQGVAKGLGIPFTGLTCGMRMDEEVKSLLEKLECASAERVVVELPYLWESTYKGDLLEKIKRIEYLDRHLIGPLAEKDRHLILLPLRHTDIRTGQIVGGAVPVIGGSPVGGSPVGGSPIGGSLSAFNEVAFLKAPKIQLGNLLSQPALV